MSQPSPNEISELLVAWGADDESVLDQLMPLVYDELRRLAYRYMSHERAGHTLQTTAHVNEAYVRLVNWREVRCQNRAHFFAVSAKMMRRILVDFARDKQYLQRGGGVLRVSLFEAASSNDQPTANLVALDEALTALAEVDQRQGQWWRCVSLAGCRSRKLPRC